MAKLLNAVKNKETACQDLCQEPDISHVFERNSPPGLRPGHRDYQLGSSFRCLALTRVSRRRSPVISGTSGDLNTGERDSAARREREYSQGEEKRAVSLRDCLVRTGAREVPGARDT